MLYGPPRKRNIKELEEERDSGLYGRYNPRCKHDHTSYDILTCEECIQYAKDYLNREIEIAKQELEGGDNALEKDKTK